MGLIPAVSRNLFAGKYTCKGEWDPEVKAKHDLQYVDMPDGYCDLPGVSLDRPESIQEYKDLIHEAT